MLLFLIGTETILIFFFLRLFILKERASLSIEQILCLCFVFVFYLDSLANISRAIQILLGKRVCKVVVGQVSQHGEMLFGLEK